jgi:hypothetical protein
MFSVNEEGEQNVLGMASLITVLTRTFWII